MNRYQQMMETLPVPEGQAERLKAAVLAAEPEKRGRRYRPWGRGRKLALAAAAAAVLLATAVGASETADWDPVFLGLFGASSQAVPNADGVFQDVQAAGVCGDVTLTVRQAIGDKGNLYLLLDYQLPEGTDVEAAAAGRLRPSEVLVYKGQRIPWEDVRPLAAPRDAVRAFGMGSTSGMSSHVLEVDVETRTVSMMIECDMNDSPLSRLLNAPVSLIAGPPALISMDEDGEDVPLTDQLAVVSFTPSFNAKTVKGSAKAEDGSVCKAEVSPLSLSVRIKGDDLPDWDAQDLLSELKALAALRFRDGTETPVTDLEQPGGSSSGGGSLTHHDDGRLSGTLTLDLVFETFLDPAEVEAVLVGDVEILVD